MGVVMSYPEDIKKLRSSLPKMFKQITIINDDTGQDILTNTRNFNVSLSKDKKIRFSIFKGVEKIGYFYLAGFPGCCGACILTSVYVQYEYQNRGIGTALNKFRIALAKKLEYSIIVCTCIDGPTKRIMEKNEWQKVLNFMNKRTYNNVEMYVYYINKKEGV